MVYTTDSKSVGRLDLVGSNPTLTTMKRSELKIVCAAIVDNTGKVWTLPKPARHYQIIKHMRDSGYTGSVNGPDQQGFLLNNGIFCRRKAALGIAISADQIITDKVPTTLTTEDLW